MATVTISMPESLKAFIDHEVATKGYGNVSEYIRGLVRDEQKKTAEARLRALLLEGLESGDEVPVDESFWRNLQTEARRRAEARKASIKKKAAVR